MTHLHIPDGLLPPVWLVIGYLITGILLAFSFYITKGQERLGQLPRVGVVAAVMLLVMSIPLGFLPVHLNLAVLAGILLGPWLGFITVFLVNLIMALVGHGGITVVGINALLLGTEAVAGGLLFRYLQGHMAPVSAGFVATGVALCLALTLLVGTVVLMDIDPVQVVHPRDCGEVPGIENSHGHTHTSEAMEASSPGSQGPGDSGMGLGPFLALVLPLGFLGAAMESIAVALVIGFLVRVRPGFIDGPGGEQWN